MNFDVSREHPKGRLWERWAVISYSYQTAARHHPDQTNNRKKWRLQSRRFDPITKWNKAKQEEDLVLFIFYNIKLQSQYIHITIH